MSHKAAQNGMGGETVKVEHEKWELPGKAGGAEPHCWVLSLPLPWVSCFMSMWQWAFPSLWVTCCAWQLNFEPSHVPVSSVKLLSTRGNPEDSVSLHCSPARGAPGLQGDPKSSLDFRNMWGALAQLLAPPKWAWKGWGKLCLGCSRVTGEGIWGQWVVWAVSWDPSYSSLLQASSPVVMWVGPKACPGVSDNAQNLIAQPPISCINLKKDATAVRICHVPPWIFLYSFIPLFLPLFLACVSPCCNWFSAPTCSPNGKLVLSVTFKCVILVFLCTVLPSPITGDQTVLCWPVLKFFIWQFMYGCRDLLTLPGIYQRDGSFCVKTSCAHFWGWSKESSCLEKHSENKG